MMVKFASTQETKYEHNSRIQQVTKNQQTQEPWNKNSLFHAFDIQMSSPLHEAVSVHQLGKTNPNAAARS